MLALYLVLYILAGVCFGIAAGKRVHRYDLMALGLLLFVLVPIIQTAQKL